MFTDITVLQLLNNFHWHLTGLMTSFLLKLLHNDTCVPLESMTMSVLFLIWEKEKTAFLYSHVSIKCLSQYLLCLLFVYPTWKWHTVFVFLYIVLHMKIKRIVHCGAGIELSLPQSVSKACNKYMPIFNMCLYICWKYLLPLCLSCVVLIRKFPYWL